jgi:hypothetical protein
VKHGIQAIAVDPLDVTRLEFEPTEAATQGSTCRSSYRYVRPAIAEVKRAASKIHDPEPE